MAQADATTKKEAPITKENILVDKTHSLVHKTTKKSVRTFRERRQRLANFLFQSTLPKTFFTFIIAVVLIVIGSANHHNDLVVCFCLGMTLLMYCVFTLENDLLKQELQTSLKNKYSTTDEQNNIKIDEN